MTRNSRQRGATTRDSRKDSNQRQSHRNKMGKAIVDALASLPDLDLNDLGGLIIGTGGLDAPPPAPSPIISEREAQQRAQQLIAEGRMPSLETLAGVMHEVRPEVVPNQRVEVEDDVEDDPDDPYERPVRFDPETGARLTPGSPEHATAFERFDIQQDEHYCIWCGESMTIHYTGWSQWIDCGTLRRWRKGTHSGKGVRHV